MYKITILKLLFLIFPSFGACVWGEVCVCVCVWGGGGGGRLWGWVCGEESCFEIVAFSGIFTYFCVLWHFLGIFTYIFTYILDMI